MNHQFTFCRPLPAFTSRNFCSLRSFALLSFLLFFFSAPVFAQLNANFSADTTQGCIPVIVHFTDLSTGGPASWQWDFGNGNGSSKQNPSATFTIPGNHTVTLTVSDGSGNTSSKTMTITVFAPPDIKFTESATSGCYPLTVNFTDQSSAGTGNIISWFWDFGNGDTSSAQNPSYTYLNPGNYTVQLVLKNSAGCIKAAASPDKISIPNGVTAGFSSTDSASCKAPLTVNFTNKSTGPGTLFYLWNFGDGKTETTQNPSHTYTAPGTYTVTLVTSSSLGCSDTLQKKDYINIANFQSSVGIPASICENSPASFTNTTNPAPVSVKWAFSDGSTYTSANVNKTFTTASAYSVKLVNTFNGGCMDSVTQNFTVAATPVAKFTADKTSSCSAPATIQFTDQSTNAVAWFWNFGDGKTSTDQNPLHIYNVLGNYTVKLVVSNASGCQDSSVVSSYIKVLQPAITIKATPDQGCVPLNVTFNSTVVSGDPVNSYQWDFGDGQNATGQNTTHAYTSQGKYTVKLTITTVSGCSSSAQYAKPILAGNKPTVQFDATPKDACSQTPIQFTDQSSAGDDWFWDFGDNTTSILQSPKHTYQDTGYFDVALIVTNNGCIDSISKTQFIHIAPPIASFTQTRDCATPLLIQFQDQSIDAKTYSWDFGDPASGANNSSTVANPSHTFSGPGSYTVKLTVTNGACNYTTSHVYNIIDEHPDFTMSGSSVCRNDSLTLTATNITTANILNYQWNFSGGVSSITTTSPVTKKIFSTPGQYNIQLITTDKNNCKDSVSKTNIISITGPTANFSVGGTACQQENVTFNDLSLTNGNAITQWIWNYGDTQKDTLTAAPFSHIYQNPGSYNVSLTVIDAGGCRHTKSSSVPVLGNKALFYSPDTLSCPGKSIRFVNQSTGATNYFWDFGDGKTSTVSSPTHSYSADGTYNIKLKISNAGGCEDSLLLSNYIKIGTPKAVFDITNLPDSQKVACPPFIASFSDSSVNYTSLIWDFGDSSSSTLAAPSHVYNFPGTYTVKLKVMSNGGCADSATRTFIINGPIGAMTLTPNAGCNPPVTVNFNATSSNSVTYQWDFGDGTVSPSSSSAVIAHSYTIRGNFKPTLILEDANGCKVPYPSPDSLVIDEVRAKFGMNKNLVCDSGIVSFTDSSHSFTADTLGVPNIYHWDFGIGSRTDDTSNLKNPIFFFNQPGTYIINMTVATKFGCSAMATDTVTVVARTKVFINGPNSGCVNAPLTFQGIALGPLTSWQWDFGNSDTSSQQNPVAEFYSAANTYNMQLIGINSYGCADTAFRQLLIHALPNINASASQNNICLGQSVQLQANDASTYQWAPATGLNNPDTSSPVATPTTNITYYVNAVNTFGCANNDSVIINVSQPFTISARGDTTLCAEQPVILSVTGGAAKYVWTPSTFLNDPNSATPIATPDSTVNYTVVGYGNDACFTDTASVKINVNPLPQVNAGPDQTVTVGSEVDLKAVGSGDVISYQWAPVDYLSCTTCADPVSLPRQNMKYMVTVANGNGCTNEDDVSITLICSKGVVYIPNTFTPNGDQQNDVFYPRGKGVKIVKYFRVFDRWGEMVFEKTNFNLNDKTAGWDGTFKGQKLNPAVYVYVTEMVCDNDETFKLSGNVTLLR